MNEKRGKELRRGDGDRRNIGGGGGATAAAAATSSSSSSSSVGPSSIPRNPASSSSASADGNNNNRLAPFNPTHETARRAALDLLDLTAEDVLFDLGCGDGRLLVDALERHYADRPSSRRSSCAAAVEEEEEETVAEEPHLLKYPSTSSLMDFGGVDGDGDGDGDSESASEHRRYPATPVACEGPKLVGVEYDRTHAEEARRKVAEACNRHGGRSRAPFLKSRVHIRHGDVMDERNDDNGSSGEDDDDRRRRPAHRLRLLDDATAIFVYLLPGGLKKVRPMLEEAARECGSRRGACRRSDLWKGISDLTLTIDRRSSLHSVQDNSSNTNKSEKDEEYKRPPTVPKFRVVSYMFSVPGWTPTRVDRTSKGSCPLYLYENFDNSSE